MLERIKAFALSVTGYDTTSHLVERLRDFRTTGAVLHPYGFYIWKMESGNDEFDMRIHAWLSGSRQRQKPDWPTHTHSVDLHSLVLCGSVTNTMWEWKSSQNGEQMIYEVGYQKNLSILRRSRERGTLIGERIQVVEEGEKYTVPAHCYHATDVGLSEAALTLVLMPKRAPESSKVVGDINGDKEYFFERQKIEDQKLTVATNMIERCLVELP